MKHVVPLLASVISLSFLSSNINAQTAADYSFRASSKTYTPVTGGTAPLSPTNGNFVGDEERSVLSIGFPFSFAGSDYTQVTATTNCYLSLKVPTDPGSHEYYDNTGVYANDIAQVSPAFFPFWDDMHGQSSGTATYKRTGKDRNRVFTFEWRNWGYFEGTVNNSLSMQVKLYEYGAVEFLYKQEANAPTAFVSGSTLGATIGIAKSTSDYQTLNNESAAPTPSSSSYITNIYFRPATNQSYMWFHKNNTNNTGVLEVTNPSVPFCSGNESVKVKIMNFGTNKVNNVIVNWEVDGVPQNAVYYNSAIDTFGSVDGHEATVTLGNVSFNTAHTIKVYTSNPNGVTDPVTKNDTVVTILRPSPTATITATGPTIFCTAGALNVALNAPSSTNSAYRWFRDGVQIPGATNSSYQATIAGDYTVVVDSNGCQTTSAVTRVENLAMPLPVVVPSGNPIMCDTLTLVANAGVTGASYQWQFQGNNIIGATNASYTATQPGNYTVITTKYTCNATSPGINVVPAIKPTPQINQNTNGSLSTDPTFVTFQWIRNNIDIPGATQFAYFPTQAGNYSVRVSNGGCTGVSDPVQINVGVGNVNAQAVNVSIYPNPASSILHVNAPGDATISISSIDGKIIMTQIVNESIDISNIANGLYLVKITDKDGLVLKTEKLVKK